MLFKDLKQGDWFFANGHYMKINDPICNAVNIETGILRDFPEDTKVSHSIKMLPSSPRVELNPIEEARLIKRLRDKKHSFKAISVLTGNSVVWLASRLRLLDLPKNIQQLIIDNEITATNANILTQLREDFIEQELENATEMHPTEFLGYIQHNYVKEDGKYVSR